MATFIVRLLLFSLPFCLFIPIELSVRENSFQAKATYVEKHRDGIELMFFGSSQTWRAINPQYLSMLAAPLAHGGSSINIDHLLFNKFFPLLPNLKCVMFEVSYHELEDSRDVAWAKNHLFLSYYGVNNYGTPTPPLGDYSLLLANPKEYLKRFFEPRSKQKFGTYNEFGFITGGPKTRFEKHGYDVEKIEKTSMEEYLENRHRKENMENYNENVKLMDEMISRCLERNVKVVLLSPPKYRLYNEYMKKSKLKRRNKFLKKYEDTPNVYIWNYEKKFSGNVRMFGNEDHLNPEGAKQFTREVNKRLEDIIDEQ